MFTAYVVVTVVAAVMNAYAAYVEFTRADWIVANLNRYGVPLSWLFLLGVLKTAAVLGLLVGIAVPVIGSAAAIGLMAYFTGAFVSVVRTRCWTHIPAPLLFLLPPTTSLVLLLISSTAV
jgi:hypothetical protein